ncbi:sugar kinase [Gallibacterium salpingitidis]|uniref:Sugar kinase n=1 Tax=Gallibacterium salpingitidis TaxID=505341 RepID=A0A1A7P2N8_9PAST|nr:sugar kinase [Gallibacterium salpingitidis]OBW95489.1 sugar kinase [Gallibacterium salpingitidis]
MSKIACIGIAVQDRIYYVDHLPSASGKFVAHSYQEVGGGPAATAAVAIAKLGNEVDFIGRLGDDTIGKSIISELNNYNVNTDLVKIYPQAQSSQSAILVDHTGERLILNYPSPDLLTTEEWLNQIDFTNYDAILCDVRWHEGALFSLRKARELGIPSILDADTTPQDITKLVELAEYVIFSEPGLKKLTSEANIDTALKKASLICSHNIYVTQGEKGCSYIKENTIHHYPGFTVDVIDTTGAGDVFHGAFAFAVANKLPYDKLIPFANAVAALKCTAPGGRQGIPTLDQVNSFLQYNRIS